MGSEAKQKTEYFVANFKDNPVGVMGQGMLGLASWVHYFTERKTLFEPRQTRHIIVAPSLIDIPDFASAVNSTDGLPIHIASQDVSPFKAGGKSHTGQISAEVLAQRQVEYVIIGHSETRKDLKLDAEDIRSKIKQTVKNGMTPIVCVETAADAEAFIEDGDYDGLIAFEPPAAIGTGASFDLQETAKVCRKIKKKFPHAAILYGGSVNPGNVNAYLDIPYISGVLVGAKTINPGFFGDIIQAAS